MIVNPQHFNYRLIIGALAVAVVVITGFSYSNYNKLKSQELYLEQEKSLILSELSDMLNRYDKIEEDKVHISEALKEAKANTENALADLTVANATLETILDFKRQYFFIKEKNQRLYEVIDSLNLFNEKLKEEQIYTLNTLSKKTTAISKLETKNETLNKKIKNASTLVVASVEASAYKNSTFGKKKITDRANRTKAIDVCITLSKNPLIPQGEKDIYIQIVNPKNNVVGDKGSISFGNHNLIYSQKQVINYTNENLELCAFIKGTENDMPFLKGLYYINVFHDALRLGSTTFELK
jgi:hypothetical protein